MEHSNLTEIKENGSLSQNFNAVQAYVKNSFKGGKQAISDGITTIKDSIAGALAEGKTYVELLTLPVNNPFKDVEQIERDFADKGMVTQEYCVCLQGKMVPASEVLGMPMEENY